MSAALRPDASGAPDGPDAPDAGRATEASRTARGALWLATSSIVVKGSQTIVLLALAALLAPQALGLVALGTLISNVTALLSNAGTANALVYWRGSVQEAARTAASFALGMSLSLTALLWVLAPWLADTFRAPAGGVDVIRGLVVAIPFMSLAWVTGELQRRELAFLRRIIPDAVSAVVGAVLAIVLVLNGHGVMGLVVGQITQGVLTLLLAWVVHPPVVPGWNGTHARALLRYGAPYSGAQLLEMVQLNLDYLFVSRVLGAASLGLYSLAFRLAYLPHLMITIVITGAAFPYLCRRRGPELGEAAQQVSVAVLSLVAPVCLGVAVLAPHVVLLGSTWAPAVPVARLLAAYAALLSVVQLVQVTMNASGRPGRSMLLRLAQVVLLGLALSAVTGRGIEAVALTQVAVAAVVAAIAVTVAARLVDGFSPLRLLWALRPCVGASLVMVAVMLLTGLVVPGDGSSLVDFLVVGVLGVVAYAGVLCVLDRGNLVAVVQLVRGQP